MIGSVIPTAVQQGLDPTDMLVEIHTGDRTRPGSTLQADPDHDTPTTRRRQFTLLENLPDGATKERFHGDCEAFTLAVTTTVRGELGVFTDHDGPTHLRLVPEAFNELEVFQVS